MAGVEPSVTMLAEVRETVPEDIPVLLNTGARADNIAEYLRVADGCIVGSTLKVDGQDLEQGRSGRAEGVRRGRTGGLRSMGEVLVATDIGRARGLPA